MSNNEYAQRRQRVYRAVIIDEYTPYEWSEYLRHHSRGDDERDPT